MNEIGKSPVEAIHVEENMSRYLNRKSHGMGFGAEPAPAVPDIVLPRYALTIWQPWAAFFFLSEEACKKLEVDVPKDVENRPWSPPVSQLRPGDRLWIHAGKTVDRDACEQFNIDPKTISRRGMLLGHARFDGVVNALDSEWFSGPFGWLLRDPIRTPDVACNGAQGLWNPRQDTLAEVRQKMREAA